MHYREARGWKALPKITFQASICRGSTLYGQLLDRFNSFFTTGSILFFLFFAQVFFAYSTVHYEASIIPTKPYLKSTTFKYKRQASRKPGLMELKGHKEAREEGVCVKRTNGRFIWALSLYHQLSGSAASIEMELGPGEVHSFIRAESR